MYAMWHAPQSNYLGYGPLKGTVLVKNIFFYYRYFFAIMHRTIVQNKIASIICSCLFFVQIFIGLV